MAYISPFTFDPIPFLVAATQTAQVELDRLEMAMDMSTSAIAAIDTKIAGGGGIENPDLFGQRRNMTELILWIEPRLPQARNALQDARVAQHKVREYVGGLHSRLDNAEMEHASLTARITQARSLGNTQQVAQLDEQRMRTKQEIDNLKKGLSYLEDSTVPFRHRT